MDNRPILVVDDDADFAEAMQESLEQRDYQVKLAGTGEQAISLIDNNGINIVLLDIRLPNMSGIQVYRYLRLHRPSLPVIFITAFWDSSH